MKKDLAEKVVAELKEWAYLNKLPAVTHGFSLRHVMREEDERYEIFAYENESKRLGAYAYFHEETREYKLRLRTGLTEFVRIEFVTAGLNEFEQRLDKYLDKMLDEAARFNADNVSHLLKSTGILEWEHTGKLPREMAGFTIFRTPKEPFPVANGSYILLSYADFAVDSGLNIFYNVFRDEFFGELQINGLPTVTYDFDAKNLSQLAERLDTHLKPTLDNLRSLVGK